MKQKEQQKIFEFYNFELHDWLLEWRKSENVFTLQFIFYYLE
jgi:hypothetical protein